MRAEALVVTAHPPADVDAAPVEMVERKGRGHPDTICDALAEELGIALSRWYLERCGRILHHNVDKALLWGGSSRPAFGGGEVLAPIELFLAGRATAEVHGLQLPLAEITEATVRTWLRDNLRGLDPDRHVRLHSLVRPGSVDLCDLYASGTGTGPLSPANDTSCGAGHAPASLLERCVLAIERHLNSAAVKARCPHLGDDVKVMGVRHDRAIAFTVACPLVDRYVRDADDYRDKRAEIATLVRDAILPITDRDAVVAVNTADAPDQGRFYLTVTGTSAESGDDGSAGRGNRVGGLITPFRPMTMESVAGKNPVSHIGKVYNVLARLVCEDAVAEVPEVSAVECQLVGQIGRAVAEPQLAQLRIAVKGGGNVERLRAPLARILDRHLDAAGELWRRLLAREVLLF